MKKPLVKFAVLTAAVGIALAASGSGEAAEPSRMSVVAQPSANLGQNGQEANFADFTRQQIDLWDAVIAGDVMKAITSIKAGADVNGLDTRKDVAGPNGRRPLNYAALRNDTTMIAALLDAGAILNLANRSGFTPLHHAAEAGSKEAAVLLIAKGADLTLRNTKNRTPIEIAVARCHTEVAEVLHRQ